MDRIYYRSDFDFILNLRDHNGNPLGWLPFDWEAKFYTSSKINAFVAGVYNGEPRNCFNDNGRIHIVMNNHRLSAGKLKMELTVDIPDEMYPDGFLNVSNQAELGIELVNIGVPCIEKTTVSTRMPVISAGGGPGLGTVYLRACGNELHIYGHEAYLENGYIPLLFRYCKWSGKEIRADMDGKRNYSGLKCLGQPYNCIITEDNLVARYYKEYDNDKTPQDQNRTEYSDIPRDKCFTDPEKFLIKSRYTTFEELYYTHGKGCRRLIDEDFVYEFAFAFVKPDIPYYERIHEIHCVSNIVPFQVVVSKKANETEGGMEPYQAFSTQLPHKRIRIKRK